MQASDEDLEDKNSFGWVGGRGGRGHLAVQRKCRQGGTKKKKELGLIFGENNTNVKWFSHARKLQLVVALSPVNQPQRKGNKRRTISH